MTRTDNSGTGVRRESREIMALREFHVALRAEHEALRHAHSVLAPFALSPVSALRPGPRPSTWVDARYRLAFEPNDFGKTPPVGPAVPGYYEAIGTLRIHLCTHLVHVQLLKEENRQLRDEVARLVGQRRAEPPWPCS